MNYNFLCPDRNMIEHVSNILAKDEYECGVNLTKDEIIIDIGGCYGSFSFWFYVAKKYRNAFYFIYEPSSESFKVLLKNMEALNHKKIYCSNSAIVGENYEGENKLYDGTINIGESSLIKIEQNKNNKYEEVKLIKVKDIIKQIQEKLKESSEEVKEIKKIDCLKVDTEGCEEGIIKDFVKTGIHIILIMFEYHSRKDYLSLTQFLEENNYVFIRGKNLFYSRGTVFFIHKDYINNEKLKKNEL